MPNFTVPYIDEDTKVVPPRRATQDAFYAASLGAENPVEAYKTIRADLQQTGTSDTMSAINNKLQVEEDLALKDTVYGIMQDESVSLELRKAIVQNYAVTGTLPKSLKDRYVDKVATIDNSTSIDDIIDQDAIIEDLPARKADNDFNINFDHVANGLQKLADMGMTSANLTKQLGSDYLEAGKGIVSGIVMSMPAGFAGLYHVISEENPEEGAKVIAAIQQAAYKPKTEGGKLIMETLLKAAETLSIPAKWIGDFVNTMPLVDPMTPEGAQLIQDVSSGKKEFTGGKPGLATTAEIVLDPLNWIPLAAFKGIKKAPSIAADSPLEATFIGNPKQAENVAIEVLKTGDKELENAVGASTGEIVHDWVLPKYLEEEVLKDRPDLYSKLVADEQKVKQTFVDFRYDPNLIEVTKREAEVAAVMDILHNSNGVNYIQSKSLINETDDLFQGNSVFGRKNGQGFARKAEATKAYNNLKERVDGLPEESKGNLSIVEHQGKFFVNWQWNKQYDDLQTKMFGPDAIQTSFLGFDVSGIARKPIGRWLFPTGRFPKWTEQAALRGIERTAVLRNDLTNTIKERISTHGHGEELDYLIREAEELGIDYFSPDNIAQKFPNMKKKEVDALYETHVFWNRQQHYNHAFLNREVKNKLIKAEMQGIYDKDGNYLGAGTTKVADADLIDIKEVWDFDTKTSIPFNKAQFEEKGLQVVRLNEKVDLGDAVREYAVIGKNTQLNMLPNEVLPRLPGYSGRKVQESWYVDVTPTKLNINGRTVSDSAILSKYTKTKAATRNEADANKLAIQLQTSNPTHKVTPRPERTENFGRVMTDYAIHQSMMSHSMKRGERLPSLNGPARLEDRMATLLNTTSSLARMGALRAWDEAHQTAFVKSYGDFTQGQFPQYATDIKPKENMGRAEQKRYEEAHASFKWYERIKNSETFGDFHWTKFVNGMAEIAEKMHIPADWLRGRKENPLMIAKKLTFISQILMAPIRQHIIQPANLVEMWLANPSTAGKNMALLPAIRMAMFADSEAAIKTGVSKALSANARSMAKVAGVDNFEEIYQAIARSGMIQSVDMNLIVHGMIRDVNRALVEGTGEKLVKDTEALVKKPLQMTREYGFDAAELTNRVGNWLQAKSIWEQQNPGKKWNTKENIETISSEALKMAGAMNRAGQLPFQEGALSIVFQYAAIQHKMLMNLLQDNATILTGAQRARLAAWRAALYGTKYGLPGGFIIHNFIDKSEDEEVKQNAELFKRGIYDYAVNGTIAALVEPDVPTDLAIGHSLSPYSEEFSPYFHFLWETAKLVDDKPAGPRYPAVGLAGAMYKAAEDVRGWWQVKEVTSDTFPMMMMEAAELASGMNSYWQGQLMLSSRDKVTKLGNKYGLTFSRQEAYARMFFGVASQKEEDLWKIVELNRDKSSQLQYLAKYFYSQVENQRVKGKEDDYANRIAKLNSFMSMMEDSTEFSQADKMKVIELFEAIDKKNRVSVNQSVLQQAWQYRLDEMTQDRQQIEDIMNRTQDPTTQQFIKAMKEGNL